MVNNVYDNGSIIKNYQYNAFGIELNKDDNDFNPFRYCGEYFDKETDNYYLRARYYNPSLGRFITEDHYWNINNMIYGDSWDSDNPQIDINAIMQSSNLYAYCTNNPMTYIDTNGNFLVEATVVAVAVLGLRLAYIGIYNYTKSNLENGNVGFNISDSDYIKLKRVFND